MVGIVPIERHTALTLSCKLTALVSYNCNVIVMRPTKRSSKTADSEVVGFAFSLLLCTITLMKPSRLVCISTRTFPHTRTVYSVLICHRVANKSDGKVPTCDTTSLSSSSILAFSTSCYVLVLNRGAIPF